MYSLSDLQQNLKSLISQLSGIQKSISEPQRNKQKNDQCLITKVPRMMLLLSICKFLSVQQINLLSMTCTDIRSKVYSPMGWKIIIRLKTAYPLQILNAKSQIKNKIKKVAMQNSIEPGLSDYDDQRYISEERNKFKTKLVSTYSNYVKNKQRYEACQDKLKYEKAQLFKIKQQIGYLNGVRLQLNEQNKSNKQKLKDLSEGFSAKIKNMDDLNDSLIKQRTKLQNQKEALAGKVREYQNQIQVIREDSEKSKQILKRLKNYLLYKQL